MKGIIVGICGLILSAHAQFNFQINQGGFRFGILGSEVVNIGGNNKNQPFSSTSFPVNMIPAIPIPQIAVSALGNPITPIAKIVDTFQPKPQPQFIQPHQPFPSQAPTPITPIPAQPQQKIETEKTSPMIEISTINEPKNQNVAEELVQKTVETIIKPKIQQPKSELIKQNINESGPEKNNSKQMEQQIEEIGNDKMAKIEAGKPVKAPGLRTQRSEQVILDVTDEKVKEQLELKRLREKEYERLAKYIHLMPESEKKHLKALSTEKTQI